MLRPMSQLKMSRTARTCIGRKDDGSACQEATISKKCVIDVFFRCFVYRAENVIENK